MSIGALCRDPKHFIHQHDLLNMLQHHESNDDQIFALSTLAVCSLGEHVRKRQIRQLIDIALESNQNIGKFCADTATQCLNKLQRPNIFINFL